VRAGRLHPGTTLPSSRALAAQLGVSRGVVVEAYAQLVAEGWLETRPARRPASPPDRESGDSPLIRRQWAGTARTRVLAH
jgi:GntR family transcriptional regulator/MocR family aminotransferase